jgi:zinc/manganese transport system permease protein
LVGFGLWAARARLARSAEGSSRWLWDFFFYACFGVVVTSSVALAGVLLVFSFLIIPAAIGMLYADGVRQLFIGWAVGVLASCAGLTASYVWDLPTGSAMVCAFGATLAIAGIVRPLRSSHTTVIAVRGARVGIALGLAASAAWIAIAPREDQPLLDAIELVSPPVREIYLSRNELQVYTDADEHAQRYSREADRLNDKEAQSRWQGEPLSDSEVRRISSFLQSYNEMRKGEEFVKREVRARARTRVRWMLAAVLLVAACALFPWRLLTKPDAARRSLGSELQAVQSNL